MVKRSKEEDLWGKVETILKSEIIRLSKREVRKNFTPLRRDVRQLKGFVFSAPEDTDGELQRFASRQGKALGTDRIPLEASRRRGEGLSLFSAADPKPSEAAWG